ncbi:hypothetical protein D9623_07885 [Azospirillum brasilense]|uniref:hypothetical protein n=1 Tax=Azospirillum brasilense TaxID=192 RepID=UPI0011EDD151|nr:hypothetical protein [Azospirillum brasilense]QEL96312.1 hypothetical protein D9623_07885 [Azospirillum brasilense]
MPRDHDNELATFLRGGERHLADFLMLGFVRCGTVTSEDGRQIKMEIAEAYAARTRTVYGVLFDERVARIGARKHDLRGRFISFQSSVNDRLINETGCADTPTWEAKAWMTLLDTYGMGVICFWEPDLVKVGGGGGLLVSPYLTIENALLERHHPILNRQWFR